MALMAWTFFIGQAVAGQDSNFSDSSTAIKTEHRFLANQLIQQTEARFGLDTGKTGMSII
jgi:hypothetical protein